MWWLRALAFAAVLAISTGAPAVLRAQDSPTTETLEAARQLFSILFDHAFAQQNALAVANLWPNLERTIRADNPNIDAGTLAELQREFEKIRLARLHEIVKDLPTIYARHLTAEQMREIAAFYRSPTGQRMLQVLPSVMTEGFALVLPRMRIVTDDSQEMFLKLLLERGLIKAVRDR